MARPVGQQVASGRRAKLQPAAPPALSRTGEKAAKSVEERLYRFDGPVWVRAGRIMVLYGCRPVGSWPGMDEGRPDHGPVWVRAGRIMVRYGCGPAGSWA
eukprot:gene17927-biopygen23387